MKNLFFVSVIFLLSGTSYSVNAQKSLRFIDGIQINAERSPSAYTISASNTFLKSNYITEKCNALQFKYAQLTDQDVEAVSNISLYNFIDDWYGTRYRLGGNTKKGIDCSSFTTQLMSSTYGYCLPRTAVEQFQSSVRIPRNELKEGDLVFFRMGKRVGHVGVYIANGYFVHSSTSSGVMISSMYEAYYAGKYAGAGRIPNEDVVNACR